MKTCIQNLKATIETSQLKFGGQFRLYAQKKLAYLSLNGSFKGPKMTNFRIYMYS